MEIKKPSFGSGSLIDEPSLSFFSSTTFDIIIFFSEEGLQPIPKDSFSAISDQISADNELIDTFSWLFSRFLEGTSSICDEYLEGKKLLCKFRGF